MKTQVKHHTAVARNLTLVLAGTLFLLIVFFSQFNGRKAETISYYSEPVVEEMTTLTHVSPVELPVAAEVAELMAETAEPVAVVEAAFTLEEHAEAEMVITDWMLDGSSWYVADEVESDVVLADWMLTQEPWVVAEAEVNDLVILEDWMLETTVWNLIEESMIAEEREEIVYLHDWMLTSEAWFDYQEPVYQTPGSERLLTSNLSE